MLPALAAAFCIIACAPWNSALAAPDGFNQALQVFKGGQYPAALKQFEKVSKTNPGDTVTRYYMGLCYHYLNQVAAATQEYQWVATHSSDKQLREQAENGLRQLTYWQATRTHQGSNAKPFDSKPRWRPYTPPAKPPTNVKVGIPENGPNLGLRRK